MLNDTIEAAMGRTDDELEAAAQAALPLYRADHRANLAAFLATPTEVNWMRVRYLRNIAGNWTFWYLLTCADPSYPQSFGTLLYPEPWRAPTRRAILATIALREHSFRDEI